MSTVSESDDTGSTQWWRDLNTAFRQERFDRADQDIALLKRLGVVYTTNENGDHMMIDDKVHGRIDFWPTTGRWICTPAKRRSRGIASLLDFLSIEHEPIVPLVKRN